MLLPEDDKMSGKACTGNQTNNADLIVEAKSFCEGLAHRSQGTAAAFPQTDNPHGPTSDAYFTWLTGWAVANDAAGGAVDPANAPCCAISTDTVLA